MSQHETPGKIQGDEVSARRALSAPDKFPEEFKTWVAEKIRDGAPAAAAAGTGTDEWNIVIVDGLDETYAALSDDLVVASIGSGDIVIQLPADPEAGTQVAVWLPAEPL